MRALPLLVLAGSLAGNLGCSALVGSFELEGEDAQPADALADSTGGDALPDTATVDSALDTSAVGADTADSAVVDTFVRDTAVADTFVPDASRGPTSCKAIIALNPSATPGPQTLRLASGDVITFCDFSPGRGGYTLVALRKSTTAGTGWIGESGVEKSKNMGSPDGDLDRVLDANWMEIGFNEVVYDLGVQSGPMLPSGTRVAFTNLTGTQQADARAALGKHYGPTMRIDCAIEGIPYSKCVAPAPPPGDPMATLGWVHAPAGTICYWAAVPSDAGAALGAPRCDTGVVGRGRVWVK